MKNPPPEINCGRCGFLAPKYDVVLNGGICSTCFRELNDLGPDDKTSAERQQEQIK